MKTTTVIRLSGYTIFLLIPILSLINCNNWSSNIGGTNNCYFEINSLKSLAEAAWGFIFMSSFIVFFPVFLYFAITILLVEFSA